MIPTNTVYTLLANNLQIDAIQHIVRERFINCILDISYTISNEESARLKEEGVTTMNFSPYFNNANFDYRNKEYGIIYSKAIAIPKIQEGLKRIHNGIEKGYNIIIIEDERNLLKSISYCIIGEYLKDKCAIIHYSAINRYYTHQEIEETEKQQKQKSLLKHQEALKLGETGEELAALHLMRQNYQILDKNWNLHKGCEIDIIARKGNTLHFIEVKTRRSDRYGAPEQAINRNKIRHIIRAIKEYKYIRGIYHVNYQIDSIAIIYRSDTDYDLKHYENITQYQYY